VQARSEKIIIELFPLPAKRESTLNPRAPNVDGREN
jgi:hypothetical protein